MTTNALEKISPEKLPKDPLIRKKVNDALRMIALSEKFKRIDIEFLQMQDPVTKYPRFAILTYDEYTQRQACYFNMDGWNSRFKNLIPRNQNGMTIPQLDCVADKAVPQTVKALVSEAKEHFDETFVAWEANWNPQQKDPLVLGRVADLFFIIAKWDVSNLESYVASEF